MPDRSETLINAFQNTLLTNEQIRAVIAHLRTLGYINEITYSNLNTVLSRRSHVIRQDGSETIELARDPKET
jgi:hypothetical protein